MKLLAVFALFCVLAYASADPTPAVYDEPTDELNSFEESAYNKMPMTYNMSTMTRHRRLTCVSLFKMGRSACARKCIRRGHFGGFCRGGICKCRGLPYDAKNPVQFSRPFSTPNQEAFSHNKDSFEESAYNKMPMTYNMSTMTRHRLTCDFLLGIGRSACAQKCIQQGHFGGFCNGSICKCRGLPYDAKNPVQFSRPFSTPNQKTFSHNKDPFNKPAFNKMPMTYNMSTMTRHQLTCDFLLGIGRSACAQKCIQRGHFGGFCNGGICKCRGLLYNAKNPVQFSRPFSTPNQKAFFRNKDRLKKPAFKKMPITHYKPGKARHPRITCDLLSIFEIRHTACALKCISQGHLGGFCHKGICKCRPFYDAENSDEFSDSFFRNQKPVYQVPNKYYYIPKKLFLFEKSAKRIASK